MYPRRWYYAVVLAPRRPKLADLVGLARRVARRDVPAAALARVVLRKVRIRILQRNCHVMPERGGEFCARAGERWGDERAVRLLRRVVFRPDRPGCLVNWICHVCNISGHVEDTKGDWVYAENAECWVAARRRQRRANVARHDGVSSGLCTVVAIGYFERVTVSVTLMNSQQGYSQ